MRRRGCVVVACGAFVTALTVLAAQDPPSDPGQPTFVAGTLSVRVDLYVTENGQLVDDLRQEEIALFEDGVPQTIDSFERVVFRAADPLEPALAPRTLPASRQLAADARSRVFVVFIDQWHTEYVGSDASHAAVQRRFPVLRTLQDELGPDDLVAIMTPDMRPEDLSFARGLMGLPQWEGDFLAPFSILRPEPHRDQAWDDVEMMYHACYPRIPPDGSPAPEMIARRREGRTLDALEALARYLGELREERKGVLLVTDGWPLYTPNPGLSAPRSGERPQLPRAPIGRRGVDDDPVVVTQRGTRTADGVERTRCEADRVALAALDHRDRLRTIIEQANRSNVSLYPVSPEGLTSGLSASGANTRSATVTHTTRFAIQSALRELAEATDGYATVNTNEVARGIDRMIRDSSAYFLIGYSSTNPTLDGRYRRITVRVSRPGVEVRARPGYVATPIQRPTDRGGPVAPRTLDPVAAALNRVANTNLRAPLRLRESAWRAPGVVPEAAPEGAFWIVGDLDAQVRRESEWAKGGTTELIVTASDGAAVLTHESGLPAFGPIFAVRVPEQGRLPSGEYTVRVQVRPASGAPALTDSVRVSIPGERTPFGEPVLWRRGPSTGPQPVRTADPRFRRNERLRLDLPALRDGPVTARLLDRTGALLAVPVTVSERPDTDEGFRWVVVEVAVAPLAPGDYVIEVAQDVEIHATAFRIVP